MGNGLNKVRYSRNLNVTNFTEAMQERLLGSAVLVVGAGGLGSVVINYLTMAGVGCIGVVEYDTVSESNLQRQILYSEADVGKRKGELAVKNIEMKNSRCRAVSYLVKFTKENGTEIARGYDLIVDCSDNYEARYAMDSVSRELGIPFVYGSAEQLRGQVATFNWGCAGSYEELFGASLMSESREVIGVLSPLPGIVGSIQALEVIKLLTRLEDNLCGKLLLLDGVSYQTTLFNVSTMKG